MLSVGIKVGLGLTIFAAAICPTAMSPPRGSPVSETAALRQGAGGVPASDAGGGATDRSGYSIVSYAAGRKAFIEVSPAVAGSNTIELRLLDTEGRALQSSQVTIDLSQPGTGVEPVERTLMGEPSGTYRWTGAPMLIAGTWTIRLDVRFTDAEEVFFETQLAVQ